MDGSGRRMKGSDKVLVKAISSIIYEAFPAVVLSKVVYFGPAGNREALTWRTPHDNVNSSLYVHILNITSDNESPARREIVHKCLASPFVIVYSSDNSKTRFSEAKAQASWGSKEVQHRESGP